MTWTWFLHSHQTYHDKNDHIYEYNIGEYSYNSKLNSNKLSEEDKKVILEYIGEKPIITGLEQTEYEGIFPKKSTVRTFINDPSSTGSKVKPKYQGKIIYAIPGMGKSTTLASMIDHINANRQAHIMTSRRSRAEG